MINDVILIFKPYRSFAFAAYFAIVMEVFWLLILGGILFNSQQFSIDTLLFVLFFAVSTAFLIKMSFDRKKIMIYFTEEGLHLINDGKITWRFVPWNDFTHMYRFIGSKCSYCVLSPEEKNKKQLKTIIRRIDLQSQITVGDVVAFPLNLAQKNETVTRISEIIIEKHIKVE